MTQPVRVLRLVLPYPPRANRYWRVFRGHAVLSPLGRKYLELVLAMVSEQVAHPLSGALRVHMDVFRPRKAGDVDGHAKVPLDALQQKEERPGSGAYLNDKQLVRLSVEHWDSEPKHPRVQVTITEDNNPRAPPPLWPLSPRQAEAFAAAERELARVLSEENARTKRREEKRNVQADAARAIAGRGTLKALAKSASYPSRKGRT